MSAPSSRNISKMNTSASRNTRRDISASRSRVFGASSLSNSSRLKVPGGASGAGDAKSKRIFVDGVDVTPQSLLLSRIKPSYSTAPRRQKGKGDSRYSNRSKAQFGGSGVPGASMALSNMSSTSIEYDSAEDDPVSARSGAGSNASALGPISNKQEVPLKEEPLPSKAILQDKHNLEEEDEDKEVVPTADKDDLATAKASEGGRLSTVEKTVVQAVARQPITIRLEESPTEMLFELLSVCVNQEVNTRCQAVTLRNKRYTELCESKKGSDKYIFGSSQTIQLAHKSKEVMTAPPATRDVASIATDWDIYDCASTEEDTTVDRDEVQSAERTSARKGDTRESDPADRHIQHQVEEIVEAALVSPGCVLDLDRDIVEDLKARQRQRRSKHKKRPSNPFHSGALSSNLSQKTRIVHSKQDIGRSSANPFSTSNSSMVSPSQSGASMSLTASQDVNGIGDSGNSITHGASQMGFSTTSQSKLSAGSSGDGMHTNAYARANTNVDIQEIVSQQRTAKVLESDSLLRTLQIVERAVQQNVYHREHLLYRDLPFLENENEKPRMLTKVASQHSLHEESDGSVEEAGDTPVLETLWSFKCELTTGYAVSSFAWNSANPDLLAVAYSRGNLLRPTNKPQQNPTATEAVSKQSGLVLFWSLKNPEFPERVYHFPTVGISSIDFGKSSPNLLAVGRADGVVAIYDTRKIETSSDSKKENASSEEATTNALPIATSVATSEMSSGQHLDAVWQVRWTNKGADRAENVVSISSDGRVTEWSLKKGLTCSDLMTLKRVPNQLLGSDACADGVISRQASGSCIDFSPSDTSIYYVGTEHGLIHKCSMSYSEQYLNNYFGHTGPVYQLLVSPFSSDYFLSCAGDWDVKMWHQKKTNEILNFRSVGSAHAVHSIAWSPTNATIFAAVSKDARIEIWDLAHSVLDPIITHFPKQISSSKHRFTSTNSIDNEIPRTPESLSTDDLMEDNAAENPMENPTEFNQIPEGAIAGGSLECTKVTFAPAAPVIVVGDSHGEITVYRVPSLSGEHSASREEQLVRLQRAIDSTKHEQ